MPGHMKQTKETIRSWTLGEAYHGSVKPKRRIRLYFHPGGKSSVPTGSASSNAGEGASMGASPGCFSAIARGPSWGHVEGGDRELLGCCRQDAVQLGGAAQEVESN
jgi:hypothetical protein